MDPGRSQVASRLPERFGWGLYIRVSGSYQQGLVFDFGVDAGPVTLILFLVIRAQRGGTLYWKGSQVQREVSGVDAESGELGLWSTPAACWLCNLEQVRCLASVSV